MACCAITDCGNPACRVCWWSRQPQPPTRLDWEARHVVREGAAFDEQPGAFAIATKPSRVEQAKTAPKAKRRDRVGPHR